MFRVLCVRMLVLLLWSLLSGPGFVLAETKPPLTPAQKPAATPKPKLTPEQKRGLDMLEAAQAEAAGLDPAMRATVLWQASHGYLSFDKSKAKGLLKDAFHATVEIDDDHPDLKCFLFPDECHSKPWLQVNILREMMSTPDEAEKLLPQADPDVRRNITGELISRYAEKKELDHAQQLLRTLSEEKGFPYRAASQLMLAMSTDEQRVSVFNMALANFQTYGSGKFGFINDEDLTTLVVRFYHHLPEPTVLDAIDQILAEAKSESEKRDDNLITVSAKEGGLSLSPYEYRLFELIPVLQELDSARAESLLRDNATVASSLKTYSNGLRSLNPTYRDTPATRDEMMTAYTSVTQGGTRAEAAADQVQDKIESQIQELLQKVRDEQPKDPSQALSTALTIPLFPYANSKLSPRIGTLADIAVASAKKNPATAMKALEEVRKYLDQIESRQAARLQTRVVETYLRLGENEQAEKSLREGMKIAEKFYASDTDASQPNLAPKAEWPSTGMWRKLISQATRVSPQLANELMVGIPDEEIRVLQKVAIANALLNTPDYSFQSVVWHKDEKGNMPMAF